MTLAVPAHPTLIAQADFMDMVINTAGDFFWPKEAGPIEKILNLAEFGSFFILPGVGSLLVMLASVMGMGFRDLGRWLDTTLGIKSFEDLANLGVQNAIDKIIGKLPTETLNNLLQEAVKGGVIVGPGAEPKTAFVNFPLTKIAQPPIPMSELEAKYDEGKKPTRAEEIREERHQAWKEDRALRNKRQEEEYEAKKERRQKAEEDRAAKKSAVNEKEFLRKQENLAQEMAKHPDVRKAEAEMNNLAKRQLEGENIKDKDIEKARKKLDKASEKARKLGEYERAGRMKRMFGEPGLVGRSSAAWNAVKNKGLLGGLLVSLTASLGFLKDIAFKLAGKFPILTAAAVLGTAAYGYFQFTDGSDPKPVETSKVGEGANKSAFTEDVDKAINEVGEEKELRAKTPKTFEDKLSLRVDMAISAAMER